MHVAFDAPDAGPYLARVTSGVGVAGGMEVLRPNGVLVPIEPVGPSGEQIAILAGLQGPYILTVYGSAAGESEIQVDPIRAEPLTVGSWRAAKAGDVLELDVDQAPVAVLIDARDGSDPVLQVADPARLDAVHRQPRTGQHGDDDADSHRAPHDPRERLRWRRS